MNTISLNQNEDVTNKKHINQNEDNLEPGEIRDDGNEDLLAKNCYFWMNTKCKFGQCCKYQHPTRCIEQMKNGRCYNRKNCKLVHPKMCTYKYCFKKNCWFNHPSKGHRQRYSNKKILQFKKNYPNFNKKKWIKVFDKKGDLAICNRSILLLLLKYI